MAKKSARLGKGLSAIVSKRPAAKAAVPPAPAPVIEVQKATNEIPVGEIQPNSKQPRTEFDEVALQELADSIKIHGLMQPIVVRKVADKRYELIAGERRWRASRLAGLEAVPVTVRECTDAESLELALVENLQREDLNPIERARAYRQYLDEVGGTPEELAQRLSQSRSNVVNYVRLLGLADEIQLMVNHGELSMGHARAIAGIADPHRQLAIARMAFRRNLSVRQVEEMAKNDPIEPKSSPVPDGAAKHLADLEASLSRGLGLPVKLKPGRKKNAGKIVIHYKNLDEFDRISERLNGNVAME